MSEERDKKIEEYHLWFHSFSVAVYNISKEFNIGSLLRTAHCAKVKEFFLIGKKSFNTYAAVSSDKWTKISYLETIEQFLSHIKETNYNLVLIDQANNSKSLFDFEYPQNPLFLLGAEKGGIPDLVKNLNHPILEIPQYGLVHSLNLSCAGSIVIYHYLYKLYKESKTDPQSMKQDIQKC